jgi:opacity protein-like surface antigen
VNKTIASAFAAASLLAGASSASAQEAFSIRGPSLGAHVNFSAIQSDEGEGSSAERGIGGGVKLGFGVTDRITVFLRGDVASVSYEEEVEELGADSYTLANVDLGGRYSFASGANAALMPYVELGLSGTSIVDELTVEGETFDIAYSGGGLLVGFGLEYFLNRSVAVDGGLMLGKGRLTNFEIDGESFDGAEDLDYTTVRMNLGLVFRL